MKPVEGHSNLAKKNSGAVVVTDKAAIQNKVAKLRAEKRKFEELQNKVDSMEGMLQQILAKLDGNT